MGLKRLGSLHINDSVTPLGSNRDRHAALGTGELGDEGCAAFLSEPKFEGLPCIFEGPGFGGKAAEPRDIAYAMEAAQEGPGRAQALAASDSRLPLELRTHVSQNAASAVRAAREGIPRLGVETAAHSLGRWRTRRQLLAAVLERGCFMDLGVSRRAQPPLHAPARVFAPARRAEQHQLAPGAACARSAVAGRR